MLHCDEATLALLRELLEITPYIDSIYANLQKSAGGNGKGVMKFPQREIPPVIADAFACIMSVYHVRYAIRNNEIVGIETTDKFIRGVPKRYNREERRRVIQEWIR